MPGDAQRAARRPGARHVAARALGTDRPGTDDRASGLQGPQVPGLPLLHEVQRRAQPQNIRGHAGANAGPRGTRWRRFGALRIGLSAHVAHLHGAGKPSASSISLNCLFFFDLALIVRERDIVAVLST